MSTTTMNRSVEILLVEDSSADAELVQIAFRNAKVLNKIHTVDTGEKAMQFLRRESPYSDVSRPDLVLLDLNLPGKDGREVLHEAKNDPALCEIPIIVLTTSDAPPDIKQAYQDHANAYMTKPVDFQQFHELLRTLEDYWFTVVRLPSE